MAATKMMVKIDHAYYLDKYTDYLAVTGTGVWRYKGKNISAYNVVRLI